MTIFFFKEDSTQVHCVWNTTQQWKCDFYVSQFCQVVQNYRLLEVA